MLNNVGWDPQHAASYVAEYLDLVETLPFDLQRNVSLMREIDAKYQEVLRELEDAYGRHGHEEDPTQQRRLQYCIQRALIRSQELGDEKIQLASQMVELVENRIRQVDGLVDLLEARHDAQESAASTAATAAAVLSKRREEEKQQREESSASSERLSGGKKRSRRQKTNSNENRENSSVVYPDESVAGCTPREKRAKTSKKKKRSKAKAEREASPADLPIDPNEPTYCLCEQVSYGEMIGCDNEVCPIEWFHFSCVGLNHKPKGKWYCPKCRGETEKTMDKALEKAKRDRACNR